jgi:hypothetical protein
VSDSTSSGVICMPVDPRPAREPDELCEGCGARGTVGRASRHDASGTFVEEHRFCADCWPEWSAFFRTRWDERGRRETLAWLDHPRDATDTPPPPPPNWGMAFQSATWHGVRDFVERLTEQLRYYRDPPSPEVLARYAVEIRDGAAERVGPMPLEVRDFLAKFGRSSSDAPAS